MIGCRHGAVSGGWCGGAPAARDHAWRWWRWLTSDMAVQKLTADKADLAEQQAEVARRERELQAAQAAAEDARTQLTEQQASQHSLEQQLQVRAATPTHHIPRPGSQANSPRGPAGFCWHLPAM